MFLANSTVLHVFSGYIFSIWLFTYSDLKTIIFPETAFGVLTALSRTQSKFGGLADTQLTEADVLSRVPLTIFWIWINLLPFTINNQRHPLAIMEDKLNKPWRTMPSQRWSARQAKYNMIFYYHVAVFASLKIGGLQPSLTLVVLGFWYNNMGGADNNGLVRNLINALGFTCFGVGALEIALNHEISFDAVVFGDLERWLLVVAAVVLSTVHIQDMYDQAVCSLPLQIGDGPARWIIVGSMSMWGVFCPYFWRCGWLGYIVSTPLAFTVAQRSFAFRTVESDKITVRIWNFWMVSLYFLPLIGCRSKYACISI
ncbi:UbiA prenyltransferase family [Xylariaceae sp. FL0662B]|nr:UbiA prenyltransferase family [Xylariaceae sp. FL0662B]